MEKVFGLPMSEESSLLRARLLQARHRVHDLLHASENETKAQRVVRITIAIIISLSVLSVILESEPTIGASYASFFSVLEIITVTLFSAEYLLRLWSIVDDKKYSRPILGRLRYIFTPFALIDLFSVLPFYLPLLLPFDLRFIRIFRLIRLVRVFKMGQYSRSISLFARVFKSKKSEIGATLFVLLLILTFSSTVMYFLEHQVQPKVFSSIPASFWWGATALTTVGYGDIGPITPIGKVFAILTAFCGIGLFTVPGAIFITGLIEEIQHKKDEVIICSRCKEEIARKQKIAGGKANFEHIHKSEEELLIVESN
jgi:voltage-gated potassium channel